MKIFVIYSEGMVVLTEEYKSDETCKAAGAVSDMCGGCCDCLAMQASFYNQDYEIFDLEERADYIAKSMEVNFKINGKIDSKFDVIRKLPVEDILKLWRKPLKDIETWLTQK